MFSTGLVYLRFSGRVTFENGKIMWKKQRNGWGLGCISSTAMRESSLNVPDDSGSNGTRPPNGAEINGVGKHLKTIARRLMLYPLGKAMHKRISLGCTNLVSTGFSIFRSDCARRCLSVRCHGRLASSIRPLRFCWCKSSLEPPTQGNSHVYFCRSRSRVQVRDIRIFPHEHNLFNLPVPRRFNKCSSFHRDSTFVYSKSGDDSASRACHNPSSDGSRRRSWCPNNSSTRFELEHPPGRP